MYAMRWMTHTLLAVGMGLTLLSTSACVKAGDLNHSKKRASTELNAVDLAGTSWRILMPEVSGVPSPEPFLTFNDSDSIQGSTGCNQFAGNITITGQMLEIGPLRMTRRACNQAWMERERQIMQAMNAITRYAWDDENRLLLQSEDGTTLLTLVARPRKPAR